MVRYSAVQNVSSWELKLRFRKILQYTHGIFSEDVQQMNIQWSTAATMLLRSEQSTYNFFSPQFLKKVSEI